MLNRNPFLPSLFAGGFRRNAWLLSVALLAAALAGCSQYYVPPPPIAVNFTVAPLSFVPLVTTDSSGNIVPSTFQFRAQVLNTTSGQSTALTWAIQNPSTLAACPANPPAGSPCAGLGTISGTGLYTAPALLPNPNTVDIMAIPLVNPSLASTLPVLLVNPIAVISSISPSFVTSGAKYTLDVKGQYFYPSTTVTVSGAQAGAITPVNPNNTEPFTEFTVPAQIVSPGLLQVQATNPNASGSGNPGSIIAQPSSPAASSTVAVEIEQVGTTPDPNNAGSTLPVYGNTAFVPLMAKNELAVVNADSGAALTDSSGQPLTIALPSGFAPSAVAANPANNTVAVISASTPDLLVVDAVKDVVINEYPLPVNTTASFSDGNCAVCAMVVDSIRNQAILDTASGYMTVALATGKTSAAIAAPAAENFAYNYNTQTAYIPFYNGSSAGLDILNFSTGALSTFQPAVGSSGVGAEPDSAAFDLGTGSALVADEASSNYALVNFNSALVSGNSISAPEQTFTPTTQCTGAWDAAALEFSTHLALLANEGSCIAVAQMASSPTSGTPASPTILNSFGQYAHLRWATLGAGPDGVAWNASPHGLAAYIGMDGHAYVLALRSDQAMLVKVDLAALLSAPAPSAPADVNQVDPTACESIKGSCVTPVTYIPLP